MADGSIAAPSLTLNDVIMTSMLLLKINLANLFLSKYHLQVLSCHSSVLMESSLYFSRLFVNSYAKLNHSKS